MSNQLIKGIHHVTSLAGDPQENVDFYTSVLGMRMVKKTINFDVTSVYHMYYGDKEGNPGTIMTTFPYGKNIRKGQRGNGQMTYTLFSVPSASLEFWKKRITSYGFKIDEEGTSFGSPYILFDDMDGLGVGLVESENDNRPGYTDGDVGAENAIKGFYGAVLQIHDEKATHALLTGIMDYREVAREGSKIRLEAGDGGPGTYIDLDIQPNAHVGVEGNGSVHHIAFATPNDETHQAMRARLVASGQYVTEFKDRQYFRSIYFRSPGGILFEVATIPPGFAVDEDVEDLGMALKLPPWEENRREEIENNLQQVNYPVKEVNFK